MQVDINNEEAINKPSPRLANPFFAAYAEARERGRALSPQQKFFLQLEELKRLAQAGDISRWNQALPLFESLSREARCCAKTHPRTQMELRRMELELLINAHQNTQQKLEELAKGYGAEEQRQKLKMMCDWLREQLVEKTELELQF